MLSRKYFQLNNLLRTICVQVNADSARTFLRAASNLRSLALVFDATSGRLYDRWVGTILSDTNFSKIRVRLVEVGAG